MKCRPITVDESLQELTPHGTREFPVSMDRQVVTDPSHGSVRHWHQEIQIALVTEGEVLFKTGEGEFCLSAGQGFFVNSGVLHEAVPTERANGVYICVNFLPGLISGGADSVLLRDYVEPVLYCESLRSFSLTDQPWHREVCDLLQKMGEAEELAAYGYEMKMTLLLQKIWYLIVTHNRETIEKQSAVPFSDIKFTTGMKCCKHQTFRTYPFFMHLYRNSSSVI